MDKNTMFLFIVFAITFSVCGYVFEKIFDEIKKDIAKEKKIKEKENKESQASGWTKQFIDVLGEAFFDECNNVCSWTVFESDVTDNIQNYKNGKLYNNNDKFDGVYILKGNSEENDELFIFSMREHSHKYNIKYFCEKHFLHKNLTKKDVNYFFNNYVFSLKEHYELIDDIVNNDNTLELLELFKNKVSHNIKNINDFDINERSKKSIVNQINQIE